MAALIHRTPLPENLRDGGEARQLEGEVGELIAPFPSQLKEVKRFDTKPTGMLDERFTVDDDVVCIDA